MSPNLRGIAFMVLGMFAFAVTDTFIKLLGGTVPTGQIMMTLGVGGGVFFTAMAVRVGASNWSAGFIQPTIVWRNIFEMIGTVGFMSALILAPLSTVSAIIQANPLLVALGAAIWLKEPVGLHRYTAIVIGLVGVLLVIQPWADAFVPASLLAVLAVFGLAFRDLVTRRVPAELSTLQVSAYALALLVPTGLGLLFVSGDRLVLPTGQETAFLALAVVFSIIGYFGTTASMRVGSVGVVTPFRYSRICFALILAVLIFNETPNALTYVGAAIIVGSGLYTLWRERKQKTG